MGKLFKVAKEGNYKILNKLLENGADFNQIDEQGYTPLYYAAINEHIECALLLILTGDEIKSINEIISSDVYKKIKKTIDLITNMEQKIESILKMISDQLSDPKSLYEFNNKLKEIEKDLEQLIEYPFIQELQQKVFYTQLIDELLIRDEFGKALRIYDKYNYLSQDAIMRLGSYFFNLASDEENIIDKRIYFQAALFTFAQDIQNPDNEHWIIYLFKQLTQLDDEQSSNSMSFRQYNSEDPLISNMTSEKWLNFFEQIVNDEILDKNDPLFEDLKEWLNQKDTFAPNDIINLLSNKPLFKEKLKAYVYQAIIRDQVISYILDAARDGNLTFLKQLLDLKNEAIEARDELGNTLLHLSCAHNNLDCVDFLIQQGVNLNEVNIQDSTPLHMLSFNRVLGCMKLLIDAGADVHMKDANGDTPLHIAAYKDFFKGVSLLVKTDPDSTYVNNVNKTGNTSLHMAALNGLDSCDCLSLLIKAGAEINKQNNQGVTPLHYAAERGNAGSVRQLILEGAEIDLKNSEGKTPLECAMKHVCDSMSFFRAAGYVKAVEFLGNPERASRPLNFFM